jgi:hypothetical protein
MGYGIGEQLEGGITWQKLVKNSDKPWKIQKTQWRGYAKRLKAKRERRRARLDPECAPEYKRFRGYEY